MSAHHYLDFDLQIDELTPGNYRARVLASPAGQAEATFDLPFSELEIENFFLRIGRPRRGVRAINSPEMHEAVKFGGKLYNAVFQGALQSCLWRSIDQAEQQQQGIRLRLRLPPSLIELPWEYLYDASRQRFLSHSTSTPIVRYLDLPQNVKPLRVTPPLKVLVLIASPRDYEALDVEGEWRKIKSAVADLESRGLIELTRLSAPNLNALQKQLRREQYHIFHFIGHGGFDRQSQEGVLLLEDDSQRSRAVSGNQLGTLLHDHPSLRLAVLNACEGARTARSDPFAGVAQQLVRQGIPAVLAMQFEITDKAAQQLAHEFYDALADGYPVDGALAEARKAIYITGNDIEWGTPVLYLRAIDGQLFDLAALQSQPPVAPSVPPQVININTGGGAAIVGDVGTGGGSFVGRDQREAPQPKPAAEPLVSPPPSEHSSTTPPKVAPTIKPAPVAQKAQAAIATPTTKRNWLRISMILVGVVALLYTGLLGAQSWQASVRRQAAATEAAIATATQEVVFATATAWAVQVQPTATALAVQARATVQSSAPEMLPLVERFGLNFVFVTGGDFLMGSPDGVGNDDEHPQRTLWVDDFWIGQTEVTNAQYRLFIEADGYSQQEFWSEAGWQWRISNNITQPNYWGDEKWNQPDYPVVGVSWYEATAYANWLSKESGLTIRLPTEAEWEKAARGIEGWTYPWGNVEPNPQLLNYDGSQLQRTSAVGSYPAGISPYGALDMAGNVWEWVGDWYAADYYQNAPTANPTGPLSGDYHVARGGSWYSGSIVVRSSGRDDGYIFDSRDYFLGFRVVRVVSPGS